MSPDLQKELRAIREEAARRGWRVWKENKYWKMYCPCPKKCKKFMNLTPSDPNYVKNLVGQLRRTTCWKDGDKK